MDNIKATDIYSIITKKIRDDNILMETSTFNNKLFNLIKMNIIENNISKKK